MAFVAPFVVEEVLNSQAHRLQNASADYPESPPAIEFRSLSRRSAASYYGGSAIYDPIEAGVRYGVPTGASVGRYYVVDGVISPPSLGGYRPGGDLQPPVDTLPVEPYVPARPVPHYPPVGVTHRHTVRRKGKRR